VPGPNAPPRAPDVMKFINISIRKLEREKNAWRRKGNIKIDILRWGCVDLKQVKGGTRGFF
jgi:hypothetical protein